MTVKKKVKFTHFQSTETHGLYAIDEDGDLWVYQGNKHGWSKLNMTRLNVRGKIRLWKQRKEAEQINTELPNDQCGGN